MPDPILLTREERERFAAYCLQEAETDKGLAEQMKKIGMMDAVIHEYETIAHGHAVVAAVLLKIQDDIV